MDLLNNRCRPSPANAIATVLRTSNLMFAFHLQSRMSRACGGLQVLTDCLPHSQHCSPWATMLSSRSHGGPALQPLVFQKAQGLHKRRLCPARADALKGAQCSGFGNINQSRDLMPVQSAIHVCGLSWIRCRYDRTIC